ncbi:MAG: hypothetical protein BGO52_03155 [Sphingobacteriales bacterium 44-61]|nr:MAG: hypothetical protein BGO52_03155 [Sphingobacteriales bacterium 44-61]
MDSSAPLTFYRREIETLSKINSTNTFHRILRQLHEFGYLRYEPSFNPALGNIIYLKMNV